MIFDEIRSLINSLLKDKTAKEVARIFGKERKWVYLVERGSAFRLDKKFIEGLQLLGYELKLVKKGGEFDVQSTLQELSQ